MALKITVHEKCSKCGARDAKVVGEMVRVGHRCTELAPGPPTSPWRQFRLSDVNFVPGDFSPAFLTQELREAWATIEAMGEKRWRAEQAALDAITQAMREVYSPALKGGE